MQSYCFNLAIVLEISGKHSQRYLNARLTNDIRLVNEQQSIEAACLTPQGRTQAYFLILKDADKYLLYTTGGDKDSVIAAFKQFIVADQVQVKDLSQEFELWHVADKKAVIESHFKVALGNNFSTQQNLDSRIIVRPRISDFGCDLLVPKTQSTLIQNLKANLISSEIYNFQRVSNNQISFPEELGEDIMFAEANLAHAISYTKGCYAGQEVMEMLASRGTAPSKIVAVKIKEKIELKKAQDIFADAQITEKAGQILSWAQDQQSNLTVAFIKLRAKHLNSSQLYLDNNTVAEIINE